MITKLSKKPLFAYRTDVRLISPQILIQLSVLSVNHKSTKTVLNMLEIAQKREALEF